jgi:hypothetical protein
VKVRTLLSTLLTVVCVLLLLDWLDVLALEFPLPPLTVLTS